MMEATQLYRELAQFCGSEIPIVRNLSLYGELAQFSEIPTIHNLCRSMLMSEGVICLREHANAFWLLDAIALHYAANKALHEARADDRDFDNSHFWVLRKKGDGATLVCLKHKGYKVVVEQEIEFTDFPFQADREFVLYARMTSMEGRPTIVYLTGEH